MVTNQPTNYPINQTGEDITFFSIVFQNNLQP